MLRRVSTSSLTACCRLLQWLLATRFKMTCWWHVTHVDRASFVMSELEREHREAMKARLAKFPKLSVGDAVEVKVRHDVDADAVDADDVVARVWALQYRLFRRPLAARAIPALPHGCTLLWAIHPALTLAGA